MGVLSLRRGVAVSAIVVVAVVLGGAAVAGLRDSAASAIFHPASFGESAQLTEGSPPDNASAEVPSTTTVSASAVQATGTTPPEGTGVEAHVNVTDYGPRSPYAVDAPSEPGRNDWSAVSDGVTLHLHMEPATPHVGDVVRFTVEATSATEPCCGVLLRFGDGYSFDEDMGFSCPDGGPAGPGTKRAETTHVYNGEGRWDFMVAALTGNCTHRTTTHPTMLGSLFIGAGTPHTGQGPSLPAVTVDTYMGTGRPDAPNELLLGASATDADGFITKLVTDWGDGASGLREGDGMGCRESLSGWPRESWAPIPSGSNQAPAGHRYASPGTYRVTVTAYSAGCDGSDVQTGSASLTWTWGTTTPTAIGPPPPPASTPPPTWPADQPCPTITIQPPGCPRP